MILVIKKEVIKIRNIIHSRIFSAILKINLHLCLLLILTSYASAGSVTVENGKLNVNGQLYVDSNGNVGIGTTAPAYKLHVEGGDSYSSGYVRGATGLCIAADCKTSWPAGGSVLPSGTSGQTLRHDGTNWVANSLLTNDGSNVNVQKNNEIYLGLQNTEASGRNYALVSAGSAGGIGVGKFSIYDKTAGISRLIIDTNGNVGIGMTGPSHKLSIRKGSATGYGGPSQVQISHDGNEGLYLTSADFNQNAISFGAEFSNGESSDLADTLGWTARSTTASVIRDRGGEGLAFYTNSGLTSGNTFTPTQRMLIDTSGNVGIGAPIPSEKLDVAGNVKGTGLCIGTDCRTSWPAGGSGLPSGTSGQTLRHDGTNWVASSLLTNDGSNVNIQKNNEVYLGLQNTEASGRNYALVSAGSAGGIGVGKFSIYDKTAGISRLIIDTNGNVGIGTTGPSNWLDLYGTTGSATQFNTGIRIRRNSVTTQYGLISQLGGQMTFVSVVEGGSSSGAIAFQRHNAGSGTPSESMIIDSTGNVGIGAPIPSEKLDVAGNVKGTGLCIGTDCRTSWPASSSVLPSGTSGQTLRHDGTNWVANSLLNIDGNGNIGIGTTSPKSADASAKTLQLGNNFIMQNVIGTQISVGTNAYYNGAWKRATSDTAQSIRMYGGDIVFHLAPTGTADSLITNWDTTDRKMIIKSDGNVGIGTASPNTAVKLDVKGVDATSANFAIAARDSADNYYFVLRNDGRVGIGTTGPGQKLTVAGTIESTSGGFKFPDGSKQTAAAGLASVMYLKKTNDGNPPAGCPSGWVEADFKNVVSAFTNSYVRTCYRNDKSCGVMYLESRVSDGVNPAGCPSGWVEADYQTNGANLARTCYIC